MHQHQNNIVIAIRNVNWYSGLILHQAHPFNQANSNLNWYNCSFFYVPLNEFSIFWSRWPFLSKQITSWMVNKSKLLEGQIRQSKVGSFYFLFISQICINGNLRSTRCNTALLLGVGMSWRHVHNFHQQLINFQAYSLWHMLNFKVLPWTYPPGPTYSISIKKYTSIIL